MPEGNEFDNTSTVNTVVSVGGQNPFNELTITKTASPSTLPSHATPGGLITYTITVFNLGTDPAFNVKVTDNLPTGTTFVSAVDTTMPPGPDPSDFTCSFSSGVVTCLGATLDGSLNLVPGVPTTREITIKVRAPLENVIGLTNVVRVDPDNTIAESNETNNSAAAATDVQSDIDLVIEKSGPKAAHQNDFTEYVLTVKNLGPATANDVLVVDPLPVGLIVLGSVVATPGNFTCTVQENPVNVVTCVGDLNGAGDPNNFDEVTITIPVFITASSGTLDNQACVDPDDTIVESNEDNNCSTNVTPVVKKAPNLLINKSVDKPTVTAGDQITYTLSISNIGDADADGPVTVTDILPTQVDFVSANPDASFTCPAPVGGTLTCTAAGGLAVGASASITIIVTAQSPLPPGTTSIVNEASVSFGTCSAVDCENEAVDPNRTHDNSSTVTSNVGGSAIDLVINSDANFDTPDPVVVGQELTHTIVVANAGSASTTTDPAPNLVVVRVNLPAGLDLNSATASGGFVCIPVGPATGPVGNVDCSGDLAAGATTTVTISSTVTATAGSSLTVTAEVDPDNDIVESNEGNNSRTAITSVVAAPCTSCIDLVMGTIFATPNPVANNNNITYNFAVTNVGDLPTSADPIPHDVVVAINLDTSFNESTVVSASAPGFSCVFNSPPVPVSAPEIVCTNTTGLAAGGGSLFSVVVFASTAATPSFVDFDVAVDPVPPNQIAEFNEGNNLGSLRVDTF